ncbi:unnamed protein product, partial [Ilex paraguariensis]
EEKTVFQTKVTEGKISVSDTAGAQKETNEQRKGKNLRYTEKEGFQNQGIGNHSKKYADQPKLRQGVQQEGIWKPNLAQKEIVGKGNFVKERSGISIQDVALEIEGNISKSTPRILERGEHSRKDMETNNLQKVMETNNLQKVMETNNLQKVMETNNLQNLLIRDLPHLNDFPDKELPVTDDG